MVMTELQPECKSFNFSFGTQSIKHGNSHPHSNTLTPEVGHGGMQVTEFLLTKTQTLR